MPYAIVFEYHFFNQCCGSGSGSGIRYPGWVKKQDPEPGWITLIIFPRALIQFFGLNTLILWCIRDGKTRIRDKHSWFAALLLVLTLIWQRGFHIWFGFQVSGRPRRDTASEGRGTQAKEEESQKGEGTSHSGSQVPYIRLLKVPSHQIRSAWKQCCGTVIIYYGSGSDFWKVMVPVPTFEKLWFRFRFLLLKKLRFRFRFQLHI